ncbi:MAG: TIR domain-containing protein [Opitutus sp.]|nr:TIR domain-containing protein [Opitutus sp.]
MSESAPRAVFISYASQDAEVARRICEAQRAAGVNVWFDESELRGGDAWDAKLRGQVETCTLFVPIVSAHTQARREGYSRHEWHLADERTHLMAEGTPFLLPVVIDETKERGALVPKSFLGVQWTRLPGDGSPAAFVQRVQGLLASTAAATPTAPAPGAAPRAPLLVAPRRSFPPWAAAALAVAVLGVGAYFALRSAAKQTPVSVAATTPAAVSNPATLAPAGPRNGPKSIAVLPFVNRSTEKETEFFTDGMHEDILTHLSHIRELRVTSRTSVEQYRGTKKTLKQIGEELGVAYVLEGSVQRSGAKVRVTGQLIRADSDDHLWAQNYDEDLTAAAIFSLQSKLAKAIAGELKAAISPEERKQIESRPTENLAAYDLYLKERAIRNSRGRWNERITLLKAAVQLDPNFAVAWAMLGQVSSNVAMWDYSVLRASLVADTRAAIANAVRLAPDSTDTLVAQARYLIRIEKDYVQARQILERAVTQSPQEASAFATLSEVARAHRRLADALNHIRKAISLEPGNLSEMYVAAFILNGGRRYDEQRAELQKLKDLEDAVPVSRSYEIAFTFFQASGSKREVEQFFSGLPEAEANSPAAIRLKMAWAMMVGDLDDYLRLNRALARGAETKGSTSGIGSNQFLAVVLAAQGDLSAARAQLGDIKTVRGRLEEEPTNPYRWSAVAECEAILGNREEALRCARKAVELSLESIDAENGPGFSASLAFVYAWTGDKDRAIAEYARLLSVPFSRLNVHEMRRNPRYHPLQDDPRFDALLNDPKNNAPLF